MAEELNCLELIASLRREQQRSWQCGERVTAEAYLQRHPQLQADPEAALELIYNEIMIRQRLGEAPRLEEYHQRFPPLAARLELLLEIHAALETCPLPTTTGLTVEVGPSLPVPGAVPDLPPVPGYEMIRELGRGGVGVVYAVQQKSLNRMAALKMLLAGGHAGAEQRARFRMEAEALARLRHPNIALIYEVGESEGRPYLVMEYVNGGSLASRLACAPWPIREAAFLVETLAQAIHHAHERGIVHRDLTPGNVLLALEDEALPDLGENGAARAPPTRERCIPKITDFGLAKLYLAEGAARTESGVIMGTPSYVAPEQAEGRSREVSPAADVYALGAILYEMLTGRPPFRGETALETLLQVQAVEPVPPSRLRPKLQADLETICLKCLQKEPGKRYPSARALAEDLRRFLVGEPIRARPVGPAGRLWRWCRRKPAVASLTFTLLLSGVIGLAAVISLWLHAREQKARAEANAIAREQERDRAEASFHDALQVVEIYLTSVGESAELKARGLEKLRRGLLTTAKDFYERFVREHNDNPQVRLEQGKAYWRLAFIQDQLGERKQAAETYGEMQRVFAELARDHPEEPEYREHLALSQGNRAELYRQVGRWDEAEISNDAARQLRVQLVRDHPDVPKYRKSLATSHHNLAILYANRGRYPEAEAAFKEALQLREPLVRQRAEVPEYRANLASTHDNLADLYQQMGRLREAEIGYGEARRLREQLQRDYPDVPEYQLDLAATHLSLGALYHTLGRLADAVAALEEAGRLFAALARVHPYVEEYHDGLISSRQILGATYRTAGQGAEALAAFREVRDLCAQRVAAHPEVLDYQLRLVENGVNLGIVCYGQHQLPEATEACRAARDVAARLVRDHPTIPRCQHALFGTLSTLASVYNATGRPAEAEAAYRDALQVGEKLVHDFAAVVRYQEDLASCLQNLANVYRTTGRFAAAEKTYRQAQKSYEQLIRDDPKVPNYQTALAIVHSNLARLYTAQQRWSEAETALGESQKLRERLAREQHDTPIHALKLSDSYAARGFLLRMRNQTREADAWFARALEPLDAWLKNPSAAPVQPYLRDLYQARAVNLRRLGRYAEALEAWDQALPLAKGPDRDEVRALRAITLACLGEHARAAGEVRDLTERGDNSPALLYNLACTYAACAAAARQDNRLSEPERKQRAEQYGAESVELLARADTAGYFKNPETSDALKTDTDFDPLRSRTDFQKLQQKIEAKEVSKEK
jgi:serine/threonine protein kinase/tetratricopeptide (TPR) repeat protein